MSKAKKIFLGILSVLALSGCDNVGVDSDKFLDNLFPNAIDALATFLAFITLLIVVFFVAYKPVKELIKKRGDYVEGKMKNAEEREKNAEIREKEAEKNVKESQKEAIAIVEKAKEDANLEKQRIAEEAKTQAQNEVNRAKEEIAQEIENSKDEIHREIVSVALDASKKILNREVNEKDNEKLINDFISDLDKE